MTGFDDINLKFPLILAIVLSMITLNFMLSFVEHEIFFITSGPGRKPQGQIFSEQGSNEAAYQSQKEEQNLSKIN